MACKCIILVAVVALAKGAVVQVTQPLVAARVTVPVAAKLEEFNAQPRYSFAYDVQDGGNSHARYETRENDVVEGEYSLIEPDGLTRRIVQYSADGINGFNAQVRREPIFAVAGVAAVAEPAVVGVAPAAPVAGSPVIPQVDTTSPDAEVEVIDARVVQPQRNQQEQPERLRAVAPQPTRSARVQTQKVGVNQPPQVAVRAVAAPLSLPATVSNNFVQQRLVTAPRVATLTYPSAISATYTSPVAYSPVSGLTYTATVA